MAFIAYANSECSDKTAHPRSLAKPSLFAHMKCGSRQRVRPKIRYLAPLDGCACAFEEWIYGGRKVPKSHGLAQCSVLFYWYPIYVSILFLQVTRSNTQRLFCSGITSTSLWNYTNYVSFGTACSTITMLHIVVTSVCIISGFHVVLGLISIVVGVVSSIKAEIWLAHSVSPIWSGGFVSILCFNLTKCLKRRFFGNKEIT